jgi:hypothetical protein
MIPADEFIGQGVPMKQTLIALAAAALVAAALPSSAQARCDGCGFAAGVIGGAAAGALIGSAIAGPPAPIYVAPPPPPPSAVYYDDVDAPVCHVERHRVWVEGYGWRHRRVEICD